MANIKSAKKTIRKVARRNAVKVARRTRVRTFIRKVEMAIEASDKTAAFSAFKIAEPEIMRAAHKGIMHQNTASRKVSRLSSRIKAISA